MTRDGGQTWTPDAHPYLACVEKVMCGAMTVEIAGDRVRAAAYDIPQPGLWFRATVFDRPIR